LEIVGFEGGKIEELGQAGGVNSVLDSRLGFERCEAGRVSLGLSESVLGVGREFCHENTTMGAKCVSAGMR
jgi:hypothetical protein